jgi:hypothetical protein
MKGEALCPHHVIWNINLLLSLTNIYHSALSSRGKYEEYIGSTILPYIIVHMLVLFSDNKVDDRYVVDHSGKIEIKL